MKTKEELDAIKNEVEAVRKKLYELTDEELEQVSGGVKVVVDDELSWLDLFFKIKK